MATVKIVRGYNDYEEEQKALMKEDNIYITIPDLAKAHELYRRYLETNRDKQQLTFKQFLTWDCCDEIETLY